MEAKMATIVDDVTGFQQRHHPQNIPDLVKRTEGFPLKLKSLSKTLEMASIPPTPTDCTTVGV